MSRFWAAKCGLTPAALVVARDLQVAKYGLTLGGLTPVAAAGFWAAKCGLTLVVFRFWAAKCGLTLQPLTSGSVLSSQE